jgi:hypothetical protein
MPINAISHGRALQHPKRAFGRRRALRTSPGSTDKFSSPASRKISRQLLVSLLAPNSDLHTRWICRRRIPIFPTRILRQHQTPGDHPRALRWPEPRVRVTCHVCDQFSRFSTRDSALPMPATEHLSRVRLRSAMNDSQNANTAGEVGRVRLVLQAWRGELSLKDPTVERTWAFLWFWLLRTQKLMSCGWIKACLWTRRRQS